MANRIIWLASYPKSGNTWIRILLGNLMFPTNNPMEINSIPLNLHAASRNLLDTVAGVKTSDLIDREIIHLRREVYQHLAFTASDDLIIKIHDAYDQGPENKGLIPIEVSKLVIYCIRSPLDVAVSFAHHQHMTVEDMIKIMGDMDSVMSSDPERLMNQVKQKLGTWSSHVTGWTSQGNVPVMVVRYEDLYTDILSSLRNIIRGLKLDFTDDELNQSIEKSRFSSLQQQEQQEGFIERNIKSPSFFREGKPGTWNGLLSDESIRKLVNEHKEVMLQFGYLDEKGDPVS